MEHTKQEVQPERIKLNAMIQTKIDDRVNLFVANNRGIYKYQVIEMALEKFLDEMEMKK